MCYSTALLVNAMCCPSGMQQGPQVGGVKALAASHGLAMPIIEACALTAPAFRLFIMSRKLKRLHPHRCLCVYSPKTNSYQLKTKQTVQPKLPAVELPRSIG